MKLLVVIACCASFTAAIQRVQGDSDERELAVGPIKDNGDPNFYKHLAYMPVIGELHDKFFGQFSLTSKLYNMLPGASFNPSVTTIPEVMAKAISPDARYMASTRHWNPQCKRMCGDLARCGLGELEFNSNLIILDKDFNPLRMTEFNGIDARLVTVGDQIFIGSQVGNKWMIDGVVADKDTTNITSFNLSHTKMGHWESEVGSYDKNVGAIVYKNATLYLLMDAGKDNVVSGPLSTQFLEGCETTYHNSIHPIFLPTVNAFLGVAHQHQCPTGPRAHLAKWGAMYSHRFFLMSGEPPFTVEQFGSEFTLPTISPEHVGQSEIIQYVTGVTVDPDHEDQLIISYGVQDCEAAIVRIRLQDVLDSLSGSQQNGHNLKNMFQVNTAE